MATAVQHGAVTDLQEGVLVLSGYWLRLAMERGHLVAEDGIGAVRRRFRFSRPDRTLRRVVIIGHAGTISLDAIRWLHGVKVPLVHLDTDGSLFLVSAPSAAMVAEQRRAQALAATSNWGRAISRECSRRSSGASWASCITTYFTMSLPTFSTMSTTVFMRLVAWTP